MKQLILIVEDEEAVASILARYLQANGFDTTWAADGQSGLDKWREMSPDLLILDWQLPDMTGIEVQHTIRQQSDVPIIMLTGLGEVRDIVRALETGADDHMTKPFRGDELLARVRRLLQSRKGADSDGGRA